MKKLVVALTTALCSYANAADFMILCSYDIATIPDEVKNLGPVVSKKAYLVSDSYFKALSLSPNVLGLTSTTWYSITDERDASISYQGANKGGFQTYGSMTFFDQKVGYSIEEHTMTLITGDDGLVMNSGSHTKTTTDVWDCYKHQLNEIKLREFFGVK
ncbi:hypothetical protein XM71_c10356 [Vibrio parahaemolyticus]|uniref:hypothetical protein n=1 Tax=Vibrio parahaemolyticus TaxID=670 RepID=UPI0009B6617A|nr:hypothetical protein [Vibrio parahaemolyticus]EJG1715040.1 hypothetical protein [Vibrio parahaemolyticus]OQK42295.1 hypothetical protein XM71_c10356 [Vibrio parahaemolyticus]